MAKPLKHLTNYDQILCIIYGIIKINIQSIFQAYEISQLLKSKNNSIMHVQTFKRQKDK